MYCILCVLYKRAVRYKNACTSITMSTNSLSQIKRNEGAQRYINPFCYQEQILVCNCGHSVCQQVFYHQFLGTNEAKFNVIKYNFSILITCFQIILWHNIPKEYIKVLCSPFQPEIVGIWGS